MQYHHSFSPVSENSNIKSTVHLGILSWQDPMLNTSYGHINFRVVDGAWGLRTCLDVTG